MGAKSHACDPVIGHGRQLSVGDKTAVVLLFAYHLVLTGLELLSESSKLTAVLSVTLPSVIYFH